MWKVGELPYSIVYQLAVLVVTWVRCQAHGPSHNYQPPSHSHHGAPPQHPNGAPPSLQNNMVHDAGHIREHYQGMYEFDESRMSPEELEFHYFKLHDFNNDTRLDGLEILKALTHTLPFEDTPEAGRHAAEKDPVKRGQIEMQYYTDIVDQVLKEDDINNDGYLTYPEYIIARRRQEAKEMANRPVDHGRPPPGVPPKH